MKSVKRYIKGPLPVVVSAPSGAGKTTICRELIRNYTNIIMSVSATTRERAKGERNGRDYFFLSREEFEKRIKKNWFVEWAKVYGQYYGTPKNKVEMQLKRNKIVLFDIDTQGGRAIKRGFPEAVLIFIMPPSLKELKKRLTLRSRDSKEEINKRLALALKEIKMRTKYDYTVVNKDVKTAVGQIESILEAESLKTYRNL